jgi:hypothetical protein
MLTLWRGSDVERFGKLARAVSRREFAHRAERQRNDAGEKRPENDQGTFDSTRVCAPERIDSCLFLALPRHDDFW